MSQPIDNEAYYELQDQLAQANKRIAELEEDNKLQSEHIGQMAFMIKDLTAERDALQTKLDADEKELNAYKELATVEEVAEMINDLV